MHRLIHWFTRAIEEQSNTAENEHQQRLESDRDLVQIVTMHGAKGLEYDIVMIPLAVTARQESSRLFHIRDGEAYQPVLDFEASAQASRSIRTEQLAEDLRLLYVSVTRARYKCYIGLANIKKYRSTLPFQDSGLAYLLELESDLQSDDTIRSALERVAEIPSNKHAIEIVAVDADIKETIVKRNSTFVSLRDPGFPVIPSTYWRITSYSALTRGLVTPYQPPGAGDSDSTSESIQSMQSGVDRFSFPKGAKTGIMLHSLLEEMDFTSSREKISESLDKHLQRDGLESSLQTSLQEWTTDILNTPFRKDSELRLAAITPNRKIAELEFHFPIIKEISAHSINTLLKQYGYLDDSAQLSFIDVEGMMTGLIDLVFEHEGCFYLVDYKSNHLGNSQQDYSHAKLLDAIRTHRYHLQYLIYCLALDRYLQQRIRDYNYDVHFGGVYYLFLRGMAGSEYPGTGIHFDKPLKSLLDQLDQMFGSYR